MDTLWRIALSNAAISVGLALLAALASWRGRRPAWAHGLWLLVLLKLIMPPLWPVELPGSFSRFTQDQEVSEPIEHAYAPVTDTLVDDEFASGDVADASQPLPEHDAMESETRAESTATSTWNFALWQTAGAVWLTGSLAWALIAGWRMWRFHRLLRLAHPAAEGDSQRAAELARRIGLPSCPRIAMIPGPVSPMLWAWFGAPRVLLPAGLWEKLDTQQRDTLMVHELAHLRRRDHWVRWLEWVATMLYWWHPVVWWARHEMERAEEACCDAWVVWALPDAARDYALALMETVDFLAATGCALPPAASGVGQAPLLRRRLTMIMRGSSPKSLSRLGTVTLAGLAILVLPVLPGWGQDRRPEEKRDTTPPTRSVERARPDQPRTPPLLPRRPETPSTAYSRADVEDAHDQLELMHAQLQAKQADLQQAQSAVELQRKQLDRISRLTKQGAANETMLDEARAKIAQAEAQLLAQKAQYTEAQIRVKQAERRLARMSDASSERRPTPQIGQRRVDAAMRPPATSAERAELEDRLRSLEDALKKSMAERAQLEERLMKLQDLKDRGAANVQDKQRAAAELERARAVKAAEEARLQYDRTYRAQKAPANQAQRLQDLESRVAKMAGELESLHREIRQLLPAKDKKSDKKPPEFQKK